MKRLLATALLVYFGAASLGGLTQAAVTPSYTNYAAPALLGRDAGEPSIGLNWTTGTAMLQAGLER